MIKGLTITDFMAIHKLELELTASLNIFAGQNEAGKSSIRDALLWGFTGQAQRPDCQTPPEKLLWGVIP